MRLAAALRRLHYTTIVAVIALFTTPVLSQISPHLLRF